MAAYRKISVTFWNDGFIQSLTPEGKYFYLFLMTNTKTTQCGIYEITIQQMVFETGYNEATVKKLIAQFEKTGKVKYSKETSEIALKNWPKYNSSESPTVRALVEKELKSIKNRVLIQYLYSMDTAAQETEAKEETETESKAQTKEAAGDEPEVMIWPTFEDWWSLYDKSRSKSKCEKKWIKIIQVEREKIMSHTEAYVLATPEKQYRKDPYTYLNNQCWNDEIIYRQNGKGIADNLKHTVNAIDDLIASRDYSRAGQKGNR